MHSWRGLDPARRRNLLIGLGVGAVILLVGAAISFVGGDGPEERLVAGGPTTSRGAVTTTRLPRSDTEGRAPSASTQTSDGAPFTTPPGGGNPGAGEATGSGASAGGGPGAGSGMGSAAGGTTGTDPDGGAPSGIGASRGSRPDRSASGLTGGTGNEGGAAEEGLPADPMASTTNGGLSTDTTGTTIATDTTDTTSPPGTTSTTVAEPKLTLGLAQNGGEFSLVRGDTLRIELEPDPSGAWSSPAADSPALNRTSTNQSNGQVQATFVAAEPGTAHVEAKTPSVTFRVTITVLAA